MSAPVIAPLPTPPSRTQPATFSERADAFLGALPNLRAQINATATWLDTTSNAAIIAAEAARDAAVSAKTAAESARTTANTARDQAVAAKDAAVVAKNASESARGTATTKATEASASAAAALASKNAAGISETNSAASETAALASKNASETARAASVTAKDQSVAAKTASELARDAAVTAKNASETARNESVAAKTTSVSAKDEAVTAKNDAVTAKGQAETARTGAQAALTDFNGKWYGSRMDAPTGTIAEGAMYFNTTLDALHIYRSGSWTTAIGAAGQENVIPINKGGTGATTVVAARTNLGMGSLATKNTADINADTTDTLTLNRGGTGATTAAAARTALGLKALSLKDKADINNDTSGTLALNRGGTGATTAAAARTALGVPSTDSVVPVGRTIGTGDGLSGGGDMTADRTLSVDSTVARKDVDNNFSVGQTVNGSFKARDIWHDAGYLKIGPYSSSYGVGFLQAFYSANDQTLNFSGKDAGGNTVGVTLRTNAAPTNDQDLTNKSYVDSQVSGLDIGTVVRTSRSISAGSGLTGGGSLSSDMTISLGTPGSITPTSGNTVTSTSHTHSIEAATIGILYAQLAASAVGVVGFLKNMSTSTFSPGAIVTGVNLRYSAISASGGIVEATDVLTGTWRALSQCPSNGAGLFVRIS